MKQSDGVSALEQFLHPDKNACAVCGAFKHTFEDFCRDCTEHKRNMDEMRRARARRRAFGSIW
jgi:hypothetical protein